MVLGAIGQVHFKIAYPWYTITIHPYKNSTDTRNNIEGNHNITNNDH
jgi:hypothetical protein